jgi:hypothetical protein
MVGLITTALGLITLILSLVVKRQEAREANTYENDIRKMDNALADRDADVLSSMFDELRAPAGTGEDNPGGQDANIPPGR